MARKKSGAGLTKSAAPPQKDNQKKIFGLDMGGLVSTTVCLLYFIIHFVPDFGGYDVMGAQWLYIVLLDILVCAWILASGNTYREATARVISNLFTKLYLAFFVVAGISLFFSVNAIEGWVCFVRLVATIVAFINLAILLYGKTDLFRLLAQILAVVLFIESVQSIAQFLNGATNTPFGELVLSLKNNTGNKNIFAAGLVMKIPFTVYCIYHSKMAGKLVNAVFLATGALCLFLVNARASYLSLILILFLLIGLNLLHYFREKKPETLLTRTGFIVIPVMIAFFISSIEISNVKTLQEEKGGYGTVTNRLATVTAFNAEDNQVRIRLWKHAIDYTSKHFFMGCGYGNWKIESIPYQRTLTNDLIVPVHSHNDYLETFAELGIAGGLLYLGLFFTILVFTIKTFRSSASQAIRDTAVFPFLGFIGYSVDAFFNFPGERPLSQVFFAFLCAINLSAFIAGRKPRENEQEILAARSYLQPLFGLLALVLLVPAAYVTCQTYRSLVVQRTVLADLNNEPLQMDIKEVFASFPPIPDLTATGQPVDGIKGRYLSEAGRYDEALVYLDKGRKANPVIGYSEFLKAGLYFKQNRFDSAFRNGMYAFHVRPRAKTYYQTLIAILAKLRDTVNIKKTFEEFNTYRPEVFGWDFYLRGMLNAKGSGDTHLLSFADSGIHLFKNDPAVNTLKERRTEIVNAIGLRANTAAVSAMDLTLSQKYYNDAITAFGSGNPAKDDLDKAASLFIKSASVNPANFVALENAAICYINRKEWKKALQYFDKELAMKQSANGKPEYFRGVALINLQQKEKGCESLKTASAKGWKEADALIKNNCQ